MLQSAYVELRATSSIYLFIYFFVLYECETRVLRRRSTNRLKASEQTHRQTDRQTDRQTHTHTHTHTHTPTSNCARTINQMWRAQGKNAIDGLWCEEMFLVEPGRLECHSSLEMAKELKIHPVFSFRPFCLSLNQRLRSVHLLRGQIMWPADGAVRVSIVK